eukprot:TRINITY_DN19717_c0_g1::TRINITY_DN19717_c0_g1_i1::g.3229::m.3229 TRINITY_DN19717_c0_g1::TRINITY_DN19717_c0_g1_i1::g.3229  ORF type:complete len:235 (-),score=13.80,sp/Q96L03/SPT17_HUMAN/33.66/7e-25,IQ/PF00612.22/0.015,IQ/PF00612.22/0.038,IQ/PF00612.22/0.18,IQ/PF00612.22/5.7e+03,OmpH/PF03938.9/0.033,OmpH/PF03938.9/2.7e+03,Claudin_3/PF06653.6/0.17,Atrophin-1/PF03154.10/0.23,Saw1/PF11561.3/1.4,PseudoU_synth_2/PF00849.17/5.2e+03,PseudoU_synth_2/PF00849.17/0.59 TRINITY_DN19717_c0_g1_i1:362-1066(-)
MATFLKLWARRNELVDKYFDANKAAEVNREKEEKAALKLQSTYRMFSVRLRISVMKNAAIRIQSIFRAYHGRIRFQQRMMSHQAEVQLMYFNKCCTLVQKIFRGYYSRKYRHNYYTRKQYLAFVEKKNEEMKRMLEENVERQKREYEERAREKRESEFHDTVQNLHHLLGTKLRPGVFNSPYHVDRTPTVFGLPLEHHLRASFKGLQYYRSLKKMDKDQQGKVVLSKKNRTVAY